MVGWVASSLKAIQRGQSHAALIMLGTALPTGLLPALVLLFGGFDFYNKYRHYVLAIANGSQFYQVSQFYGYLYPCAGDCTEGSVALKRALTAMVSGNGAAFLVLTATMGSLTFRWLFISQYFYFLLLVFGNRNICGQSPALRRGYTWLHAAISRAVERSTRALWPSASMASTVVENFRSLGFVSNTVGNCIVYQLLFQLIFGFWLPCWAAYARELQSRKEFLKARRRDRGALYPSAWEVVLYTMPALAFPWIHAVLAELQGHW